MVVFNMTLPPTPVFVDNMAVIAIFRRRSVIGRMRHVRIAISFILDAIDSDQIYVQFVPTKAQKADALTKAVSPPQHAAFVSEMFA